MLQCHNRLFGLHGTSVSGLLSTFGVGVVIVMFIWFDLGVVIVVFVVIVFPR